MSTSHLSEMFTRIGARVKVRGGESAPGALGFLERVPASWVRLDVRRDAKGEFFEIRGSGDGEVAEVLHVAPRDRHLLLLVREGDFKHKFLCGHDERHWFVAAVPDTSGGVGSVASAKEALKPPEVRARQELAGVPTRDRNPRKNAAFRRQGEWFLLPTPDLKVEPIRVIYHEPIRRGSGKPHWAEMLYRTGGETVRFSWAYPNGLTEAEYRALREQDPREMERRGPWRVMRRGMEVYIRGRLQHADHKTIRLNGWHRVLMNTETESQAMRNVAFLD